MIRRRRPVREIPFSFDSFLDVVANVVGIIIRLILVAWVGTRSYKAIVPPPLPPPAALSEPAALPEPTEPRLEQLARKRQDVLEQRDKTLGNYRTQERAVHDDSARLKKELRRLVQQETDLAQEQAALKTRANSSGTAAKGVLLSVAQLQKRSDSLLAELEKLRKQPRTTKKLRYHTPVSAAVQDEEVMFECKAGRVTLLDRATLEAEIVRTFREKAEKLRDTWEVRDVTGPVGAFRLRYVVARERTVLDGPMLGTPPSGPFRASLSWEAEPIQSQRGETAEQALSSGSAFRKLVDLLDARETVVTLWVYPDSFPLYRALRDYLHGKEVVVAGRPLPDGFPIGSSRKGTASRGQ